MYMFGKIANTVVNFTIRLLTGLDPLIGATLTRDKLHFTTFRRENENTGFTKSTQSVTLIN